MRRRILSLTLVTCMTVSLCGCSIGKKEEKKEAAKEAQEVADLVETETGHSLENGKEETVYVITDADGKVTDTIVSAHLKNGDGASKLTDQTDLKDIENVKGEEDYYANENGSITWNADGKDIYYQGTTDKELPVEVQVTYDLDHKTVKAQDLKNVNGHLTITFRYVNHTAQKKLINGKEVTMYQPFLMISGTLLDQEKASNIKVTNGQMIDTGEQSVIVGMAMPGLQESLGLSEKEDPLIDVEIPEEVVIEADVKDYTQSTVMSIATNKALDELGLDDVNSIDDLKDDIGELTDATEQLIDGAGKLDDGMGQLADGTKDLDDGVGKIAKGMSDLADGNTTLADGAATLASALDTLNTSVQGASEISIKDKETTIKKSAGDGAAAQSGQFASGICDALGKGIADKASAAGTQAGTQTKTAVETNVKAMVDDVFLCDVALTSPLSGDSNTLPSEYVQYLMTNKGLDQQTAQTMAAQYVPVYLAAKTLAIGSLAAQGQTLNATNAEAAIKGVSGSPGAADSLASLVSGFASAAASEAATGTMNQVAGELKSDATKKTVGDGLKSGLSTLGGEIAWNTANSVIGEVNTGLKGTFSQLGSATKQLAEGSKTLAEGAKSAAEGAKKLDTGTTQLDEGVGDLVKGAGKLADGTGDLKDGLKEFDQKGIQKLADIVNDDLDGFYQRLKAVKSYAEEYSTFGGCMPGTEASVKFIYKMDGVEE